MPAIAFDSKQVTRDCPACGAENTHPLKDIKLSQPALPPLEGTGEIIALACAKCGAVDMLNCDAYLQRAEPNERSETIYQLAEKIRAAS